MLTPEQRRIGRRNFIKAVGVAPVAGAFGYSAGRVGRVKVGWIGLGDQGGVLLDQAPDDCFDVVAVCDIYPPSRAMAAKKAERRFGTKPKQYEDYAELLQHKKLEAVVIAAPLWMHAAMANAALAFGLHVFCEKMMALTIEDARDMVRRADQAGKVLQIGHQRRYNPLYQNGIKQIRDGLLGEVYHIRCVRHGNDSWRRSLPDLQAEQVPGFDPSQWGYDNTDHWRNWRLYRKYAAGLMGELPSQQIDVLNWLSAGLPRAVFGTGGIYKYKDGRNVDDHVFATLEYRNPTASAPDDLLTCVCSAITTNELDHDYEQIMGTKGSIIFAGPTQAMYFQDGQPLDKPVEVRAATVTAGGPVMTASATRPDAAGSWIDEAASAGGPDRLRPYADQLRHFAMAVRTGRTPLCTGPDGLDTAVAVLTANQAIDKKQRIEVNRKNASSQNG